MCAFVWIHLHPSKGLNALNSIVGARKALFGFVCFMFFFRLHSNVNVKPTIFLEWYSKYVCFFFVIVENVFLPVRAILYGGNRLPFRAPRAKPAPNATQIAPTTVNPMYNGQSEPETSRRKNKQIKQTQMNFKFKQKRQLINPTIYDLIYRDLWLSFNFRCARFDENWERVLFKNEGKYCAVTNNLSSLHCIHWIHFQFNGVRVRAR